MSKTRRPFIKIGDIFPTNFGGDIIVIENLGKGYHKVRFSDGTEVKCSTTNIYEGTVKNRNSPKIYGVGFIGEGIYSKIKDRNAYDKWCSMLQRCYSIRSDNSRYRNCSVCDKWKSFQLFAEDFYSMIGCDVVGWHLDKDLIMKGNKVYCPEFCSIIPQQLNNLVLSSNATRGNCPIGVHLDKKKPIYKYVAEARMNNVRTYIGAFKTPEEAFLAYKNTKEEYIKEVVALWKNRIDKRVFDSLMSYEISIND